MSSISKYLPKHSFRYHMRFISVTESTIRVIPNITARQQHSGFVLKYSRREWSRDVLLLRFFSRTGFEQRIVVSKPVFLSLMDLQYFVLMRYLFTMPCLSDHLSIWRAELFKKMLSSLIYFDLSPVQEKLDIIVTSHFTNHLFNLDVHVDCTEDLLLFRFKIKTSTKEQTPCYYQFSREIIFGSIWGLFPIWRSFAVGDYLWCCSSL